VVPIKRVDRLLEAFALVRSSVQGVHLAVVGDGEIRGELEELATQLGVDSAVSFLGYRRDLSAIAAASDVAVLSSDNEGTPVSLIEAGAAGRPAVSTDVGGVAEVVTPESGLLVPPEDVRGLAEAITRLAEDAGLRRAMGESARAHVLGRYSVDRLIGDIDALYRTLLQPMQVEEPVRT